MKMDHLLFLDIETVPVEWHYESLSERKKELFTSKMRYHLKDGISIEDVYKKAGIYAEFGKIVCISCGFIDGDKNDKRLRIKSYYGHDERQILRDFSELLNQNFNASHHRLCAHNGKEFDFPFICRRLLINDLPLPKILNIQAKKPWEIQHYDTMEMWKFGDYKHFTSLDLLTEVLEIESPKCDMDGSDVGRVYWEEKDLEKIVKYCRKDVIALSRVYFRLQGMNSIQDHEIVITDDVYDKLYSVI